MSSFLEELRREVIEAHAAHGPAGASVVRRRPPVRRVVLGVAFVAALLVVVAILGGRKSERGPVKPRVVGVLRIGGSPVDAVAYDGALWVVDSERRSIVRVDPGRRRVAARIPAGGQPGFIAAAEDGGLWVHAGSSGTELATVSQIDPGSDRVIARVTVGPEGPMTVAAGYVWAAVWAGSRNRPPEGLYRVDARTHKTLPRIALPGIDRFAAGGGTVWALTTPGTLARIDARTGRIERRWPRLGVAAGSAAGANALAADDDGVWVLSTPEIGEGSLVHVSGDRRERPLPLAPAAWPVLAVTDDGLWTAHGSNLRDRYQLIRHDPRSGRVTATVGLGDTRPVALTAVGRELWVTGDDGTVLVVAH